MSLHKSPDLSPEQVRYANAIDTFRLFAIAQKISSHADNAFWKSDDNKYLYIGDPNETSDEHELGAPRPILASSYLGKIALVHRFSATPNVVRELEAKAFLFERDASGLRLRTWQLGGFCPSMDDEAKDGWWLSAKSSHDFQVALELDKPRPNDFHEITSAIQDLDTYTQIHGANISDTVWSEQKT